MGHIASGIQMKNVHRTTPLKVRLLLTRKQFCAGTNGPINMSTISPQNGKWMQRYSEFKRKIIIMQRPRGQVLSSFPMLRGHRPHSGAGVKWVNQSVVACAIDPGGHTVRCRRDLSLGQRTVELFKRGKERHRLAIKHTGKGRRTGRTATKVNKNERIKEPVKTMTTGREGQGRRRRGIH